MFVNNNRDGMALILAILTLLVLSILATGLVIMANMESKMTSNYLLENKALEAAQAGFSEAALRLKISGTNSIRDEATPINPRWVAVIASTVLSGTPTDSSYHFYQTLNNDTSIHLQYTDTINPTTFDPDDPSTWGNNIVIKYKMKIDTTVSPPETLIYFHDNITNKQFAGPPDLAESYSPVIEVYVKGRSGTAVKSIKAEIARVYRSATLPASWTIPATQGIHLTGRADLESCGHNHKYSTPYGIMPGTGSGECYDGCHIERLDGNSHPTHLQQSDDECTKVGCVAAVYTDDYDIWTTGAASTMDLYGNPDVFYDPNIDVNTPPLYELLGFSSEQEMNDNIAWIDITSSSQLPTSPPPDGEVKFYRCQGNLYLYNTHFINGVLWVQGDLTLGNGAYLYTKGIIYVEGGLLKGAGNTWSMIWTLGAMVVRGDFADWGATSGNRKVAFLYCKKAHDLVLEQTGNVTFQILGWKEIAE